MDFSGRLGPPTALRHAPAEGNWLTAASSCSMRTHFRHEERAHRKNAEGDTSRCCGHALIRLSLFIDARLLSKQRAALCLGPLAV
jgi:hypothetical protein